jgi:predicted RNase H-like HicB family nuclease
MDESVVTLTLRLEIATKYDGDQWLAWCRPLDILSQGNSKKEAMASLKEAIELWFESCLQRGVLDDALREVGFKRGKPEEKPPTGAKNIVHVEARDVTSSSDFTPDYIEVSVPAYIAAHQLENSSAAL